MDYPITVNFDCQEKVSRLTTFIRSLMIIPQWIALWAVGIAVGTIRFVAWWYILFTGRYPAWAFNFTSGYIRWYTRVNGYYLLLTDKYPPFSIE